MTGHEMLNALNNKLVDLEQKNASLEAELLSLKSAQEVISAKVETLESAAAAPVL